MHPLTVYDTAVRERDLRLAARLREHEVTLRRRERLSALRRAVTVPSPTPARALVRTALGTEGGDLSDLLGTTVPDAVPADLTDAVPAAAERRPVPA